MTASKPDPVTLVGRVLRQHHPSSLMAARPAPNLWRALGNFFSDERLQQLFARYATYVGSSPLSTPATLMLIAHVELEGVWLVDGGMHRLAAAMADLGRELGIDLHLNTHVSEVLVKGGKACGRAARGRHLVCPLMWWSSMATPTPSPPGSWVAKPCGPSNREK
jgi:1-hydroxycarotenoid 3,4-desaturase